MTLPILHIEGLSKRFVLHQQHGAVIDVLQHVDLQVYPGECVVLDGPSGMGKSTLLKLIYGNYRAHGGRVWLHPGTPEAIDLAQASPRELLALRHQTIGYVSQFLRVIPRVSALDVVAESLLEGRVPDEAAVQSAREQAGRWLKRLRIPEPLWALPPATFSGGEQQRVNIARSLIKPRALLLLDEPTASLDAANTQTVIELVAEARARGAAIVGVFHDPAVAAAVATRRMAMQAFRSAA
ncbi:MAG: phosphonate C-P lyase system protein PhnL [Thiomonas sp.]|uniref:phosphonate C-P lyase system protein PhnL n=1 Tax=Thiomonas sp. TaxID=2047785 RepID=UPI002A36F0BD|nr:phosphonate C-P lyase system protein PhnL [Thiomonas sp.]MDY0329966.1 phosphonate C-P lyase system protein PhnL [Thiomonas sp.]